MSGDLICREAAVKMLREKAQGFVVSMFATSSDCNLARVVAMECASEVRNMEAVDAEPVRLRIDVCDVDEEKGWYRRLLYCPCGQLIKTETWDAKRCFGTGTVLRENKMPKHCPNCGAKMDKEERT